MAGDENPSWVIAEVDAVDALVREAGIRQFIDIGSGIPTEQNVHEVAQAAASGSRVVYVDNDEIAVAHSRLMLEDNPDATVDDLMKFVPGPDFPTGGIIVGNEGIQLAYATGKGRVIMFANNPVYRWQNHGEFNMVFNSILNWNDVPKAPVKVTP